MRALFLAIFPSSSLSTCPFCCWLLAVCWALLGSHHSCHHGDGTALFSSSPPALMHPQLTVLIESQRVSVVGELPAGQWTASAAGEVWWAPGPAVALGSEERLLGLFQWWSVRLAHTVELSAQSTSPIEVASTSLRDEKVLCVFFPLSKKVNCFESPGSAEIQTHGHWFFSPLNYLESYLSLLQIIMA